MRMRILVVSNELEKLKVLFFGDIISKFSLGKMMDVF